MVPHSPTGGYWDGGSQVLWEDGERVFRRGWQLDSHGKQRSVLLVLPATDHPSRSSVDRLTHEYELKDELDGTWAARPLDLVRDGGPTMLVLEEGCGWRGPGGGSARPKNLDVITSCPARRTRSGSRPVASS